jgi:hypothetical protein
MRVHELAEELGMTSEDLLAELRAATPTSADSEVTPALAQLARDRAEQRRVARAKAWLPAPVRHLLPSRPLVKRFGTELAAVYIFLCLLAGMSGTTLVLKLVDFGPLTPADGLALGQIVLGIFPLSLAVAVTGVLLTHMERDAWHPYLVLALVVIVMTVALAVAVAVGHVDNIELSVRVVGVGRLARGSSQRLMPIFFAPAACASRAPRTRKPPTPRSSRTASSRFAMRCRYSLRR